MRYHNITKEDMLNGDGLRVVLWVAGCSHGCKGCQNPITLSLIHILGITTDTQDKSGRILKETLVSCTCLLYTSRCV